MPEAAYIDTDARANGDSGIELKQASPALSVTPGSPGSPGSPKRVQRGGVAEFVLSVRFLLPFTVALVVLIMAVVTIVLMALNTEAAVESVVDDLHDQVLGLVRNRVRAHLDTVLTVNRASAGYLSRVGLPPPPSNATPVLPAHKFIADILDDKINNFPVIDVHYIFYRNGRVVGVLRNDDVTNLYAEEFPNPTFTGEPSATPTIPPARGLYMWMYEKYNVSQVLPRYSTPADVHVPDYSGFEREYFTTVRHDVPFDYSWTNPYTVGPFLLFTNTISILSPSGEFMGVMGADSYITTLNDFLASLRPTPQTKVFVVDPDEFLVIATHGSVLYDDGSRIFIEDSPDGTVAAAGRALRGRWRGFTGSARREFRAGGKKWLLAVEEFFELRARLTLAVATPEEEFLGPVQRATTTTIAICVAVAVVGLAIIITLCIIISRSLNSLDRKLQAVSRLDMDEMTSNGSGAGGQEDTGGMFSELQRTNDAYLKLRQALHAFKHYVPIGVVHGVLSGDIEAVPGMRHSRVAVSFQDIVSFTTLCEDLPTDVVVYALSKTFEQMSEIIGVSHGTIDKYIGDAIMSFWEVGRGAVGTDSDACLLALGCMLKSFQTEHVAAGRPIRLRSGVHFGEVLLGNFGSRNRFNYTIVGDTVNTAARLEPLNKEFQSCVCASEDVISRVSDKALLQHTRRLGRVRLVGKSVPMGVYEVRADRFPDGFLSAWSAAVAEFDAGHFVKAKELFMVCNTMTQGDPVLDQVLREADMNVEQPMELSGSLQGGIRCQQKK